MLVAKKLEFELPQEEIVKVKKVKKQNKKINKFIKFKIFGYSVIVLIISLTMLLRLAYISQMQYEVLKLDAEIKQLNEQKDIKLLRLEKIRESKWIEEAAVYLLDMKYPSNEQIVYINLEEENIANKNINDKNKFNIVKSIKNTIDKFERGDDI